MPVSDYALILENNWCEWGKKYYMKQKQYVLNP